MEKLSREEMRTIQGGKHFTNAILWTCADDGGTDFVCWATNPSVACGYQGCTAGPGCAHPFICVM